MSKFLHTLAAAAVMTLGSASFADGNDLFSDVRTNSVFDNSPAGTAEVNTATPRRVTKPEELRDMLKSTGFEAKVASRRTVTTKKELAPWTFPVMVILAEDETSVSVVLGLNTIKDVDKELPAKTLLEMMNISQNSAPAVMGYHTKRERTELSMVLKNRNLTGQILRDEINRLAIIAKRTDKTWAPADAPAETPQQNTTTPQTAPQTAPQSTPQSTGTSLVGRWSAARSATEAFAVEFKADQTFNLVYINNGQQTKSSGTFTTNAGSLSLTGDDGSKLEGRLSVNSQTQFTLTLNNTAALVFTKAN